MTAISSFIEDFLSVTIVDGVGQTIGDGLQNVAILANVALDGSERFRPYTTTNDLAADVTAGEIDASTSDAVTQAFAQSTAPRVVYVIRWDVSGGETAAQALDAAVTAGLRPPWDYVSLTINDRDAADIVSASDWAEARRALLFAQSGDSDWITSGVPAGFSTIVDNNKTFMLYEDTASAHYDSGWAGRVAGALPDVARPSSMPQVAGLVEYTTLLTDAQKAFAGANNCNFHQVLTPKGTARAIRSADTSTGSLASKALSGRVFGLQYSIIYLEVRLIQKLGELVAQLATRNQSLPAGTAGIAMARARVETEVLDVALRAGYIQPTEALPLGYDLTYTLGSGADPVLTITGDVAYLGEIGSIAIQFTLV